MFGIAAWRDPVAAHRRVAYVAGEPFPWPALALATRAELLLPDEPTSGLDPLMEMVFRESVREARERGQTIFLSSHILSEVEAAGERVGILRQGRLVDEGTLSRLRHLGAQRIEVTFDGPAPQLPPLEGVAAVSAGENALRFEVRCSRFSSRSPRWCRPSPTATPSRPRPTGLPSPAISVTRGR